MNDCEVISFYPLEVSSGPNVTTARGNTYFGTVGTLNSTVLLIPGGWNGPNYFSSVEIFDFKSNTTSTATLLTARAYMASAGAMVDGHYLIFFIGGRNISFNETSFDDIDVFNSTTKLFVNHSMKLLQGLYNCRAVVVYPYLYVIGGLHNTSAAASKAVDVFDLRNFSRATTFDGIVGRFSQAVAVLGDLIYIAGGYLSGSIETNLVEVIDTKTWTTFLVANLSTPVARLSGEVVQRLNGSMVVFSFGSNNERAVLDVNVYTCGNGVRFIGLGSVWSCGFVGVILTLS